MSEKFASADPETGESAGYEVTADVGSDADSHRRSRSERDGDEGSLTRLVFGMGSTPERVASRIRQDEQETLEEAGLDPDDVSSKEYSYRMLLDAGVEESVADALRRRLSLPWSFETDGDLDRRSTEVRGLGEAERAWIAASEDERWQAFEHAGAGRTEPAGDDRTGRPCPRPTPVTAVAGVGPDDADVLADAGIISAERLATVDANEVARLLELDVLHVRTWRYNARELLE
ncbi:DUF7409 domain-containing protein [Natrarchaeobaculum sulfurireducens]|uniref:DUF7409 domain-containing protein n=1 Tax=Natrarchaeobaculum sulfurireducens TaxID=2044521 RepID=UPI0026984C72